MIAALTVLVAGGALAAVLVSASSCAICWYDHHGLMRRHREMDRLQVLAEELRARQDSHNGDEGSRQRCWRDRNIACLVLETNRRRIDLQSIGPFFFFLFSSLSPRSCLTSRLSGESALCCRGGKTGIVLVTIQPSRSQRSR